MFGMELFLLDQYSATSLENEVLVSISFEGSSYSTNFPSVTSKNYESRYSTSARKQK